MGTWRDWLQWKRWRLCIDPETSTSASQDQAKCRCLWMSKLSATRTDTGNPHVEPFLKEDNSKIPSNREEPVVHPYKDWHLFQGLVFLSHSQSRSQHHFLGLLGSLMHRHEIPLHITADQRVHFVGKKVWEWVHDFLSCSNGVVRKKPRFSFGVTWVDIVDLLHLAFMICCYGLNCVTCNIHVLKS